MFQINTNVGVFYSILDLNTYMNNEKLNEVEIKNIKVLNRIVEISNEVKKFTLEDVFYNSVNIYKVDCKRHVISNMDKIKNR